ncbi:MAG: hypothetical protein LBS84_01570 [Clostridiales bacterium]|nr:hypothetical protein [Clostridiales bacterium]
MKPLVKINFDEIFANTPFLNELGSVIFGAELALKYTNASDAELKEVKVKIARSAFASFSLDYDAMLTAAQPSRAASPPRAAIEAESTPFYVETRGTDTAVDSEAVPNETDSETNFDYYPNVSQLDSEYSGSPADSEPRDYSPRSAESPAGGGFSMDVNDDFEQTVV